MSSSINTASSSSSSAPCTYDVFLSFRGDDTRNNIVSHLHSNLVRKGIKTFLDDDGLKRGQDISTELHKAIQDSRVAIVVFSENYASSKWCLDELASILECRESKKQMVYPVFYKVDPSDLRNGKGSFGESLADHAEKGHSEKVVRWREALKKASNLSGMHFLDGGNEARLIDAILEGVSARLLHGTHLNVAKYPVGIESRVQDVLKLLRVRGDGVHMVGIWGVGGIGKTTLAKAVYNSVAYQFQGSLFLANVREESMTSGGFLNLQKIIISGILGWKSSDITSVDQGLGEIRSYMRRKRALLILDDVNHLNQLNNLVGDPNWFGSGSRIIITTRDKHCLTGFGINDIYKVEKLSHHEALELFNLNAFEDHGHLGDYVEVVKNVLLYAQGLPLALEVLAANLRGRDIKQWKYALDSYRSLPKQEIREVLKISYLALEHSIKEVFLHIACFFKGKSKNDVTKILRACDLNPEYAIDLLEEKSLIVVTEEKRIQMHDLLEEMGREIVFQESPNDPCRRSRLWCYEDVYEVFMKNTRSDEVQAIVVNNWNDRDIKIHLSPGSFSTLKNLQIFMITGIMFTGDHVNYLPYELRVLDWLYCPLLSFPSNFNPMKLVLLNLPSSQTSPLGEVPKTLFQLKMPWSCKSQLGKGVEIMQRLIYIDLSHCHRLTNLGDFSRFPNLVDLKLSGCKNLVAVDPSIGFLENLVSLNLGFCEKLNKFEITQDMRSLKCLDLSGTSITEISPSFGHFISLEKLTLRECAKLTNVSCSIFELQHLRHVDLFWCDSLVTFPTKSESSISLHGKHFDPLFISLDSCTNLQEILEFPREIDYLNVRCCSSLKRMSKLSNILEGKESKMIRRLNLFGCSELSNNLARMKKNHLSDDSAEWDLQCLFFSCQQSTFEVLYPDRRGVPFSNTRTGVVWRENMPSYELQIGFSGDFNWENKGLAFCAVSDSWRWKGDPFTSCNVYINGVNIMEPSQKSEEHPWRLSRNHVWLYYIPFHTVIRRLGESGLPPPFMCVVKFEFKISRAKAGGRCGVHVVMAGDEDDVTFSLKPVGRKRKLRNYDALL